MSTPRTRAAWPGGVITAATIAMTVLATAVPRRCTRRRSGQMRSRPHYEFQLVSVSLTQSLYCADNRHNDRQQSAG